MARFQRGLPEPAEPRSSPQGTTRTPERQKLAERIAAHAKAIRQKERILDAWHRIQDQIMSELGPAVRAAQEALIEARTHQSEKLVDALLDGMSSRPTAVEDAERDLAEAQKAVAEARKARALLKDEADTADFAVDRARHELERAVAAVVDADPTRAALRDQFFRYGRRCLRLAVALKTSGLNMMGCEAHGLQFKITQAPQTMDQLDRPVPPDPAWAQALAALHEDPDASLPDLLDPDEDRRAAAA